MNHAGENEVGIQPGNIGGELAVRKHSYDAAAGDGFAVKCVRRSSQFLAGRKDGEIIRRAVGLNPDFQPIPSPKVFPKSSGEVNVQAGGYRDCGIRLDRNHERTVGGIVVEAKGETGKRTLAATPLLSCKLP